MALRSHRLRMREGYSLDDRSKTMRARDDYSLDDIDRELELIETERCYDDRFIRLCDSRQRVSEENVSPNEWVRNEFEDNAVKSKRDIDVLIGSSLVTKRNQPCSLSEPSHYKGSTDKVVRGGEDQCDSGGDERDSGASDELSTGRNKYRERYKSLDEIGRHDAVSDEYEQNCVVTGMTDDENAMSDGFTDTYLKSSIPHDHDATNDGFTDRYVHSGIPHDHDAMSERSADNYVHSGIPRDYDATSDGFTESYVQSGLPRDRDAMSDGYDRYDRLDGDRHEHDAVTEEYGQNYMLTGVADSYHMLEEEISDGNSLLSDDCQSDLQPRPLFSQSEDSMENLRETDSIKSSLSSAAVASSSATSRGDISEVLTRGGGGGGGVGYESGVEGVFYPTPRSYYSLSYTADSLPTTDCTDNDHSDDQDDRGDDDDDDDDSLPAIEHKTLERNRISDHNRYEPDEEGRIENVSRDSCDISHCGRSADDTWAGDRKEIFQTSSRQTTRERACDAEYQLRSDSESRRKVLSDRSSDISLSLSATVCQDNVTGGLTASGSGYDQISQQLIVQLPVRPARRCDKKHISGRNSSVSNSKCTNSISSNDECTANVHYPSPFNSNSTNDKYSSVLDSKCTIDKYSSVPCSKYANDKYTGEPDNICRDEALIPDNKYTNDQCDDNSLLFHSKCTRNKYATAPSSKCTNKYSTAPSSKCTNKYSTAPRPSNKCTYDENSSVHHSKCTDDKYSKRNSRYTNDKPCTNEQYLSEPNIKYTNDKHSAVSENKCTNDKYPAVPNRKYSKVKYSSGINDKSVNDNCTAESGNICTNEISVPDNQCTNDQYDENISVPNRKYTDEKYSTLPNSKCTHDKCSTVSNAKYINKYPMVLNSKGTNDKYPSVSLNGKHITDLHRSVTDNKYPNAKYPSVSDEEINENYSELFKNKGTNDSNNFSEANNKYTNDKYLSSSSDLFTQDLKYRSVPDRSGSTHQYLSDDQYFNKTRSYSQKAGSPTGRCSGESWNLSVGSKAGSKAESELTSDVGRKYCAGDTSVEDVNRVDRAATDDLKVLKERTEYPAESAVGKDCSLVRIDSVESTVSGACGQVINKPIESTAGSVCTLIINDPVQSTIGSVCTLMISDPVHSPVGTVCLPAVSDGASNLIDVDRSLMEQDTKHCADVGRSKQVARDTIKPCIKYPSSLLYGSDSETDNEGEMKKDTDREDDVRFCDVDDVKHKGVPQSPSNCSSDVTADHTDNVKSSVADCNDNVMMCEDYKTQLNKCGDKVNIAGQGEGQSCCTRYIHSSTGDSQSSCLRHSLTASQQQAAEAAEAAREAAAADMAVLDKKKVTEYGELREDRDRESGDIYEHVSSESCFTCVRDTSDRHVISDLTGNNSVCLDEGLSKKVLPLKSILRKPRATIDVNITNEGILSEISQKTRDLSNLSITNRQLDEQKRKCQSKPKPGHNRRNSVTLTKGLYSQEQSKYSTNKNVGNSFSSSEIARPVPSIRQSIVGHPSSRCAISSRISKRQVSKSPIKCQQMVRSSSGLKDLGLSRSPSRQHEISMSHLKHNRISESSLTGQIHRSSTKQKQTYKKLVRSPSPAGYNQKCGSHLKHGLKSGPPSSSCVKNYEPNHKYTTTSKLPCKYKQTAVAPQECESTTGSFIRNNFTTRSNLKEESTRSNFDVDSTRSNLDVDSTRSNLHGESTRPNLHVDSTRPNLDVDSTRPNLDVDSTRPNLHGESTRPNLDVDSTRPKLHGESTRPNLHVDSTRPNLDVDSTRTNLQVESDSPNQHIEISDESRQSYHYGIARSSEDHQQKSRPSEEHQKIFRSAEEQQQISRSSEEHQQIPMSSEEHQPISRSSEEHHPIFRSSEEHQQKSRTSDDHITSLESDEQTYTYIMLEDHKESRLYEDNEMQRSTGQRLPVEQDLKSSHPVVHRENETMPGLVEEQEYTYLSNEKDEKIPLPPHKSQTEAWSPEKQEKVSEMPEKNKSVNELAQRIPCYKPTALRGQTSSAVSVPNPQVSTRAGPVKSTANVTMKGICSIPVPRYCTTGTISRSAAVRYQTQSIGDQMSKPSVKSPLMKLYGHVPTDHNESKSNTMQNFNQAESVHQSSGALPLSKVSHPRSSSIPKPTFKIRNPLVSKASQATTGRVSIGESGSRRPLTKREVSVGIRSGSHNAHSSNNPGIGGGVVYGSGSVIDGRSGNGGGRGVYGTSGFYSGSTKYGRDRMKPVCKPQGGCKGVNNSCSTQLSSAKSSALYKRSSVCEPVIRHSVANHRSGSSIAASQRTIGLKSCYKTAAEAHTGTAGMVTAAATDALHRTAASTAALADDTAIACSAVNCLVTTASVPTTVPAAATASITAAVPTVRARARKRDIPIPVPARRRFIGQQV